MTIKRLNDDYKGISIIQDPNSDDFEISYCSDCALYRKKQVRLCPLITLESNPLPADIDDFKQCPVCYTKVPIYEVRTEGTLHTDIEPVKSPFEFV